MEAQGSCKQSMTEVVCNYYSYGLVITTLDLKLCMLQNQSCTATLDRRLRSPQCFLEGPRAPEDHVNIGILVNHGFFNAPCLGP